MRPIKEIIVHCTATRPEWFSGHSTSEKVAEVRRWHVSDRGWDDIGYHYLIDRDGTLATGRPLDKIGAHTQGHNTGSIGIALFGGHGSSKSDTFDKNFTPEQDAALRELIGRLEQEHGITKVSGHNQYAAKACPGFNAPAWYKNKPPKKERTSPAQSKTVQASAVQIASGAGAGIAAVGALDGMAQIVLMAFIGIGILAAAWVMRERIRKWAEGDR